MATDTVDLTHQERKRVYVIRRRLRHLDRRLNGLPEGSPSRAWDLAERASIVWLIERAGLQAEQGER